MPKIAGIEEPIVVGAADVSADDPNKPTAGGATLGAVSGAAGGAAAGASLGPIGAAAGAVIGALVSAFKSIGQAISTSPDDARRFLYEIGAPLRNARVAKAVSPHDLLLIRHARYLDIADNDDFGLQRVDEWYTTAGEVTGQVSVDQLLAGEAQALIALELERVLHDDGDADVPTPDTPKTKRGEHALERTVIESLRADDDLTDQIRARLARVKGGVARYTKWVGDLQAKCGDRGPNPMIPEDRTWWWMAGAYGLLAMVGFGLLWRSRRGGAVNAVAALDPAEAAFHRVLTYGVHDGELEYLRTGFRPMLYFHKAFGDAKKLGISPTELAVSGRFFGREVLPVRITVHADGSVHLDDGRHLYTAAKSAGAAAILADVYLYDSACDVVAERRAAVRLL